MTALEHMAQVQQVSIIHGGSTRVQLMLMNVTTQQEEPHEFMVQVRIGEDRTVFFALVPVAQLVRG